MEDFRSQHGAFCSLAGHPKGLLVLSEKCRIHMAGVTLAKCGHSAEEITDYLASNNETSGL
eukprot:2622404-Amphidinium_carterae.1